MTIMPAWKPNILTPTQLRFLHAQEQKGKKIGFKNTADSIYTYYVKERGFSHERAAQIAKKTAGMQAVRKGIKSTTRRKGVMRELPRS